MKFNKDNVFAIYTLYKSVGDNFASDIMYHQNCMTNHIKFQRDVNKILEGNNEYCDIRNIAISEIILEMVAAL